MSFVTRAACIFALICGVAQADEWIEYPDVKWWDFTATAGVLLPRNIPGVRETLPTWGFMFSYPSPVTQIEYGFLSARAKGVVFNSAYINLRIDYRVFDAADGFLTIGPDVHYYRRRPSRTREFPFKWAGGMHAGFGAYVDLTSKVAFRTDFKFSFNPGKNMYGGVGLMYRFKGQDGSGATTTAQELREADQIVWNQPEGELP